MTSAAEKCRIEIDRETLKKLCIYKDLLKEWNEKINLTAITDDEGVALKHFADCLLLFKYVDIKSGASLIDVGTGAGFPGLVIAAARSDINVTLLDSTGKKLKAVKDIADNMGLKNVTVLHARAEEAGRSADYRERFDYATARAVAQLNVLCEYCLPLVKVGGNFLAMKGASGEDELAAARGAIKKLGGEYKETRTLHLPGGDTRTLILCKKISQTPTAYPRNGGKIAKSPLK